MVHEKDLALEPQRIGAATRPFFYNKTEAVIVPVHFHGRGKSPS